MRSSERKSPATDGSQIGIIHENWELLKIAIIEKGWGGLLVWCAWLKKKVYLGRKKAELEICICTVVSVLPLNGCDLRFRKPLGFSVSLYPPVSNA